jgi:uncharacterized protein YigE (DUF2233 family)
MFAIEPLSAQTIVYKTDNTNIGFGKASNVTTNQYMEFCVNGPLVGDNNLPVGGYVDNKVQIQDWEIPENGGGNFAVRNSIFGLGQDGHFYICSYEERNNLPKMQWAFQNGPLLVKEGINSCGTSQTRFMRSGIGITKDNNIVVIVSLTPVTFTEFADLFVKENCIDAIYLDGGPYVGCADKGASYGSLVTEAIKLQFFKKI